MNRKEVRAKFIGRTKENHEGRRRQADKISGENNPSKREDVRQKISSSVSGINNGMHGNYGEKSPVSVLTDSQRLEIISSFESGKTRKELYEIYKDFASASTIKKIIQYKDKIKEHLEVV